MIEFEIVDEAGLRQVVDALASLVDKRRVVFIAFDDEPVAVGKARALAKIVREAANQIAWIEAVVLEHPGQQRSRGRFAMGARDYQWPFSANEKFLQQFR